MAANAAQFAGAGVNLDSNIESLIAKLVEIWQVTAMLSSALVSAAEQWQTISLVRYPST
jgi:hypothetical protein